MRDAGGFELVPEALNDSARDLAPVSEETEACCRRGKPHGDEEADLVAQSRWAHGRNGRHSAR